MRWLGSMKLPLRHEHSLFTFSSSCFALCISFIRVGILGVWCGAFERFSLSGLIFIFLLRRLKVLASVL
jgi:hypothetical protein